MEIESGYLHIAQASAMKNCKKIIRHLLIGMIAIAVSGAAQVPALSLIVMLGVVALLFFDILDAKSYKYVFYNDRVIVFRGVFTFQCVYCKNMKIDYSAASATQGHKEGDTIRLSQGQIVKIHFEDNRPLSKIIVGVGWDPVSFGSQMDVDSSVIVAGNKERDVIYFGNLNHPSGCVTHHGDNLTGENRGANDDDENITVYLDKVPSGRDKLIFVLNIYNCVDRHQKLGNIKNMYIRLYDPISKKAIIEYKVDSNIKNDTALIIGMAYKQGRDWNFKAIGKGSRAVDIQSLADECMRLV